MAFTGYAGALMQHDYMKSIADNQRHRSKQNLWGMVLGFALPFALPWLIGTLGAGTAVLGAEGAPSGALGKWFPKLFTPEKMAVFGKTKWFQPMMKSLLAGGGTTIGALAAGKPPDTPFDLGGTADLWENRQFFGSQSMGKMGQTFMGEYAELTKQQTLDEMLDKKLEGLFTPDVGIGRSISDEPWFETADSGGLNLRTPLRV